MAIKKTDMKFTIKLNQENPRHVQAAEVLNMLGRYGKADYIAEAVLLYEECRANLGRQRNVHFDDGAIGAALGSILRGNAGSGSGSQPATAPPARDAKPPTDGILDLSETAEELAEDEFNAVAGALEMFRSK